MIKKVTERDRSYHPLVYKILYAKTKTPWAVIKEECKLDEDGEIDVEWVNSLDEEQQLRLELASYVQNYFNREKAFKAVDKLYAENGEDLKTLADS